MPFKSGKRKPAKKYHTGAKKKKAVKKPKMVKPKDAHDKKEMQKAMKFVSSVKKAMMAYGIK